jgi:F420-non-reducing hydrogenase iron-sulfur subunit
MAWEPKIVGFLCNWCTYTGADLAGVSRIKSPPNVRAIRIMCTGRADPTFIVKAFALGADGVLISGCHPGDCHYTEGNFKALRRVHLMKRLLRDFGIEPERLHLAWVSASEGDKWAETTTQFTETIRRLGPLRLSGALAGELSDAEALELSPAQEA